MVINAIIFNNNSFGLDQKKSVINIKAHQSALSCLELNSKGTKLATTSEKVLNKIFNKYSILFKGNNNKSI